MSSLVRQESGNKTAFNPLIDQIFSKYRQEEMEPIITIGLPRGAATGALGIMHPELISRFKDWPAVPVAPSKDGFTHNWSTKINGFKLPSSKELLWPNSTVSYDTGSTFSWVPSELAQAIYEPYKATYNATSNLYIVPCDQTVEVDILIGGLEYFMHPLDTTLDMGLYCVGTVNGLILFIISISNLEPHVVPPSGPN